jgi:ABC-type multidrug transport system ATPase subunit
MISAAGVSKTFRPAATARLLLSGRLRGEPVTALDDVTLDVGSGEVVGLMGENGAGKSTLLRIFAGLLVPSAGTVQVAGLDASRGGPELARKVGYVAADERGLTSSLTPRDLLSWYCALHGLERAEARTRTDELLDEMGMRAYGDRRIRELSTGMRRRVALARGLIGRPAVLLLDEPTRGVDPAGAAAFHQLLRATGCTIVIATHDRDEARELCTRVAVMSHARLVAVEPPDRAVGRLRGVHLG